MVTKLKPPRGGGLPWLEPCWLQLNVLLHPKIPVLVFWLQTGFCLTANYLGNVISQNYVTSANSYTDTQPL